MPASMIIAVVGSMRKVSGNRIDTAAVVPIPGRIPTTVPTVTPIKQNSKLAGNKATWKPCKRFDRTSIFKNPVDREEGSQKAGERKIDGNPLLMRVPRLRRCANSLLQA